MTAPISGWHGLPLSPVQHFFVADGGKSLCGHWHISHVPTYHQTHPPDPNAPHCRTCETRLSGRRGPYRRKP